MATQVELVDGLRVAVPNLAIDCPVGTVFAFGYGSGVVNVWLRTYAGAVCLCARGGVGGSPGKVVDAEELADWVGAITVFRTMRLELVQ